MDIFGLDGFGIKILDEIFLCSKCHNELSAKDLDVTYTLSDSIVLKSIIEWM